MIEFYKTYFNKIRKIDPSKTTEKSYRTYIHNFLNDISKEIDKKVEIIHEHKKEEFGQPDFKILRKEGLIGYLETKPLNDNLDNYLKTEQLKRYLSIIRNFILTNYNDFILFKDGKKVIQERLFSIGDKSLKSDKVNSVNEILNKFFTFPVEKIKTPENLASLLSSRTKLLKQHVSEYWSKESSSIYIQKLKGLFDLFKDTLIEDIGEDEFFDTYSQTITYGLFLSKLNINGSIDKKTSFLHIPKSLGVIEEIFELFKLTDIPNSISWIVDDIIEILNIVDIEDLKKNLSSTEEYDYKDPYVYFYEQFLYKYDKEKRKSMGVYYTPIPVVQFIVRSIDKSLQRDFNKTGFDDEDITVLDFATGTGTFLLETFKIALDKIDKDLRSTFIRDRLLKNFFGFEYLISPYTICHLKLTQYLYEHNFSFKEDERLEVYLTDTLDDTNYIMNVLYPKISDESIKSYDIKFKKPIMIIMGNPPYNIHSRNNKPFILEKINKYKEELDEKNTQPLNDDYVKFIRYSHWKISQMGRGIIGIITNNSYLDGIIHRIMRKKIYETFDKVYILNLHGHSTKGEKDKNIFKNIQQGVSIVLFIKLDKSINDKEVYFYSSLENGYLTRKSKMEFLNDNDIETVNWKKIHPGEPDYWFVKEDITLEKEYNKGWSLEDIFKVYGSGVQTGRDDLFIDFYQKNLEERMEILFSKDFDENFVNKFNVKNSGGYSLLDKLEKYSYDKNCIHSVQYRPFDNRKIYYQIGLVRRPSDRVLEHLINKENIGLVSVRQFVEDKLFNHCFITDKITDIRITLSNRGTGYIFPLNIYLREGLFEHSTNNFKNDFWKYVKGLYNKKVSSEDILGYIYSILQSPTYRLKYSKLLKKKFPRIIFTNDKEIFLNLSYIGKELICHHLLKKKYTKKELPSFEGQGNLLVEKPNYDKESERLYINDNQYFKDIQPEIYHFEICGYKVLESYLKYRKGKKLELSEIAHIKKVSRVLSFTIEQMERIDEETRDWI